MVVVAAAKPHLAAIVRRHNAILRAAHDRIDGSLEEKLAALIQPILEKAGNQAAARFQKLATNHLTAALHERADQQALQRIAPGLADDGFFGYRLRPFALAASAPTPNSAMICVKPRPDEAADIAWPDGETAESLHVTLVYLGPVDGSLQEIADALAPVAASHAPLEGVVGGVGKFQPPGVAILLPDVPGLVELRVAVTEALVERGIFYSRDHGFEAHVSIDAAPDPDTLEEALARTAQKPLHFDSILIVRGDSEVVEVPLIGPPPVTASGLVAAGEHVGWTGPAGDELIDVDKLVASLRTKTDPVRMAVLKSSMDPALEAAGISFDVSNPLTAKVLSQAGSQVKGIAETTQLNVMRIIDRSYNQGLSIPDTAKAIRAGMSSASDYRARTIARTELAGAANGGSLAATMLAAGALGIGFYKQWLTAEGAAHPRHEDYEGLDGQTVGLEDAFDVGGNAFQFPGDPDGVPEDSINCRCSLAYTETPPEGAAVTAEPEGGLTDEGVSDAGTSALAEVMPLTAPAGDTVSVGVSPFVPSPVVDRIKALGLDKPLKDVRPTTEVGREVYAQGPTTEDLFMRGGEWTQERQQIHADIVAKHFEGKTPPVAGSPKTAIFTSGGGASGKGSTMIDIGDRHFPLSELEDHPERFPDVVLMNPDIIKAMLPEYEQLRNAGDLYAASGVHEESSAIGKVVAEMAQRQGYNVVIDTTGSSSSFVGKLEQAVKDGYEVKVRMVSIPTNEAVVRAMARGDRSGRYVAIDPLKGAHRGASGQLAIWKDMPNLDWQLFDNTDGRVLVAEKKAGGEIVIHDQAKLDQILAKANETSTVPSAAVERITAAEPATGPASEALVQPVTLGRAAGGPEARDALAAIDKVHTLPPLRTEPVPVTSNPELRAENGARLVSHSEGAAGVIPDRIEINPMGTHIELDVAHEVGHEIDYSLLQQDRGAVIEAAHTTDAWKNLEKIDTTHGEYLRRDREVFARAYAQWIAERSGNEAMLRALDNYAEDAKFGVANQQWTREDFAPVAAEFDKLFGDRGLLLVTPPAAPVTTAEAASAKLATATAAEPTVTPSLVGIAEQTGGRMEGLDFRVKGQASMERKISADVAEAAQDGVTMTPEEAAARINDALRYTMVFPDANYTEGVTQALAKLKENGFEQIKLKNFWGNPDYQGINGVFEKNGQRIELQFHTPMSFKVKEGQLHPLFEKYRVSTDPSESGKLWVAMEKASASVPQPVGVQSLGTLERHAPPSGLPVPEPALVADTRTVAEIVPGPDAETLAHVQSYQQTRLDGFAANYPVGQFGNSVNEIRDGYRAAVDQKIADLTAAADVQIRVTPHILDKIVDDGRFKSQFEVEHSGGAFNRTLRSQAEQTMFGYSRDLPVEERPIYGYLSGSTSEDGSISQYGPIIIRLTDAAANRATFTLTDSLGAGERRELAPVALADGQAAGKTDAFSTYTTKDPLKATSLAEISDVYAEAQVHGGVTLADIAEVILPKEEIAYRLEGLNHDIGLLEDRVAREQEFIDAHGEAAAQASGRTSIARLNERLADYQAQAALLVDDAAALRAKLATVGIKATLS